MDEADWRKHTVGSTHCLARIRLRGRYRASEVTHECRIEVDADAGDAAGPAVAWCGGRLLLAGAARGLGAPRLIVGCRRALTPVVRGSRRRGLRGFRIAKCFY
jgi:hypothetical protein